MTTYGQLHDGDVALDKAALERCLAALPVYQQDVT
jgi:hypothetical protein